MTHWPRHGRIAGPIVMIGFGSIGKGTLPLIERHFEFDQERFVVIDPSDADRKLLDERGVRFALSTPGVHGFCTPGDIGMLPAVLDAAEGYVALSDEQLQAAVDAMATGELIFPMPG